MAEFYNSTGNFRDEDGVLVSYSVNFRWRDAPLKGSIDGVIWDKRSARCVFTTGMPDAIGTPDTASAAARSIAEQQLALHCGRRR